jgi:hypothetical protein
MPHSIYDQSDDEAVHAHFDRVVQALAEKLPRSPSTSRKLRPDVLGVHRVPQGDLAIQYLRSRSSRAAILPHGRWTGTLQGRTVISAGDPLRCSTRGVKVFIGTRGT